MANFADCRLVEHEGKCVIVSVTSGTYDGIGSGCWWVLHSKKGKLLNHGFTKGWDGKGAGSMISSMKAGKAAARRFLKNKHNFDSLD
jgi:hypothetical protein